MGLVTGVVDIPPGPFDFNNPALKWTTQKAYRTTFLSATFPIERLGDFVAGENIRNRKYHCNYGPEDQSGNRPKAEEKAKGEWQKPAAQGRGLKRGCKASFTARQLADRPQLVEIRYNFCEHVNHGESVKGPGIHYTNAHVSDRLRKFVELQVALGVPAHEIVKQNEDSHLHAYMARNGLTNREAALQSFMASQPERDYFLNANDVQNIQRVPSSGGGIPTSSKSTAQPGAAAAAADNLGAPMENVVMPSIPSPPGPSPAELHEECAACTSQANQEWGGSEGPGAYKHNPDNWLPFHLGFMRESGVDLVLKYGWRGLQMDSTFGTNGLHASSRGALCRFIGQ
ncbi:g1191 [Coccomyxa elongata]